jgi:hypothetical protein
VIQWSVTPFRTEIELQDNRTIQIYKFVTQFYVIKICSSRWSSHYEQTLTLTLSLILERGAGWVVSITPRPLCPQERDTRYPLYSRLGRPQGRSGRVRKISPPHRDSIPGQSSLKRVAIPTELSRPTIPVYFIRIR